MNMAYHCGAAHLVSHGSAMDGARCGPYMAFAHWQHFTFSHAIRSRCTLQIGMFLVKATK